MGNSLTSVFSDANSPKAEKETDKAPISKDEFISIFIKAMAAVKHMPPSTDEKVMAVIVDFADLIATKAVTEDMVATAEFYHSLSVRGMLSEHLYKEYGAGLAKDANSLLGIRSGVYQKLKNDMVVLSSELFKRDENVFEKFMKRPPTQEELAMKEFSKSVEAKTLERAEAQAKEMGEKE